MAMEETNSSMPKLKVLELYSGIGGMHWALKESGIPYEIVMAVDINSRANQIYQHNFPDVCLQSFGIEKLTLKQLAALNCNTILMSPPCQPFTRSGKKGDCDDVRTKSFLHLLQLIRSLEVKPHYILVENVKGFETSRTRELLAEMLQDCHYFYHEFLLNPLQFGIPNSRLRYYLTARLIPWPHSQAIKPKVLNKLPELQSPSTCPDNSGTAKSVNKECDWPGKCSSIGMLPIIKPKSCDRHLEEAQSFHDPDNSDHHLAHTSRVSSDSYQDSIAPRSNKLKEDSLSSVLTCSTLSSNDVDSLRGDNRQNEMSEGERFTTYDVHSKDMVDVSHKKPKIVPACPEDALITASRNMRFCDDVDSYMNNDCRQLAEFMEIGGEENLCEYFLTDKNLRLFVIMDVVLPVLRKSMCFTKRYGHLIDGAGSVVQMSTSVEETKAASALKSLAVRSNNKHEWGEEELSTVRNLKLRYFTPREVANLLCFPSHFTFPEGFSIVQKFRVLGNSLNVHVVSEVIKFMVA